MILYVMTFISFTLLMVAMGMDLETAFSAVATCINNLGLGLGEFASNFQSVSDGMKWILSLLMLLGLSVSPCNVEPYRRPQLMVEDKQACY